HRAGDHGRARGARLSGECERAGDNLYPDAAPSRRPDTSGCAVWPRRVSAAPRRLSSAPSIASHKLGLLQDMTAHGVFHLPTGSTARQTQRGYIQGIQAEHIAVLAATGWWAGSCIPLVMQVVPPGDTNGCLLFGKTCRRARDVE